MERELHINMLNGKNSELMQTGLGVDAALLFWKVRSRAEDNHRSPLGASLPWRHAPDSRESPHSLPPILAFTVRMFPLL